MGTPMLKKFYDTLHQCGDTSLKIIFVSSDKTEHEMWKYMYDAHGDWLALAFNCQEGKNLLSRQFQVQGIPQVVVIDQVGRQAVKDARGEVAAAVGPGPIVTLLSTYSRWKTAAGVSAAPAAGLAPKTCPCDQLPLGTRVRLRGLKSAPEHNGSIGVVQSYDASKQRYNVELEKQSLALRAPNLLQLLKARARQQSSSGGYGEGEGSSSWVDAEIIDFEEEKGELMLQCEGETDTIRAKLDDVEALVLLAGARVMVHGLQSESAQQWNEHMGAIVEFDEAAGRYLVQVSATAQLKLRPQNLRL